MAPIDLSSSDLADLEQPFNTTTDTVGRLKHAQALYGQAQATALMKLILRLRAPRLTAYNPAQRFESRSELTPEARVDDGARKGRLCATFFETPTKNIAPRFGFAYDVLGDGKTAIRGGFGVFYEEALFSVYRQAAYGTLPFIQTSAISASQVTSLRVSPAAFGDGAPLTETITFDLRPTYMLQYNLKLQREFFGTVLAVAYVGLRDVYFFGQGDLNTGIPQILLDGRSLFTGNEPFRDPNFSTIRSAIQGFSPNYNGLNLSATPDDQALRIEGRRSRLEG